MDPAKRFEDLWIWQQARSLVKRIYKDFGPTSSGYRDYSFKDQIQRAGISIMNNIAEGFERDSNAEFIRYLFIAKGSCGEVRSMYYAAEDLKYIDMDEANIRRSTVMQIAAGIASLVKHIKAKG